MKDILKVALDLLRDRSFDCLAYALVDFKKNSFESFEISCHNIVSPQPMLYFDLASLTKPLTLSSVHHKTPELFSDEMLLLLNHRAGLPAWGLLPKEGWKEYLQGFELCKTKEEYSDYSALRLMLELEKTSGKPLEELCSFFWDKELCHWTKLPSAVRSPVTGQRSGKPIIKEVNDPNAWSLRTFCSHAGLFASVNGLGRSLLNLQKETNFLRQMTKAFERHPQGERFLLGWDTAAAENSLAGQGHGPNTFGHLGFTGTSIWIDSEQERGQILLTNGTRAHERTSKGVNFIRRELGKLGWGV